MNPDEIAPGETSMIKLGIENNAQNDIIDVSVALDLKEVPFAPFDSSSEFNIDKIRDGEIEYAEFEIIALNNAASGIYKIPVQISYEESGTIKTKDSLISISVNSDPLIGVSVEDGLLLKNQKNDISVRVVNKGLSDVKFLEVEIGSSTSYTLLSQKNIYIGDLDSDDFDSVDFTIYFKPNTLNTINLPVSITYKDALNEKYTEEFTIPLTVYSQERAIELGLLTQSNTQTYVVVIIVLIVAYIVYRKVKKYMKFRKALREEKSEEVY